MKNSLLILGLILLISYNMNGQNSNNRMEMSIPHGRFIPMHKAEISGMEFNIGVDNTENSLYISTRSSKFRIKNENIIGRPLSSFKNKSDIRSITDWGYYLKLDEYWYARFGAEDDDSKVFSVLQYKFGKYNDKPPVYVKIASFNNGFKEQISNNKVSLLGPYNRIIPSYKTKINGIEFSVEVDDRRNSLYISTFDPEFRIKNEKIIGRPLSSFKNKNDLRTMRGWGSFLKIDKNWYAAFDWKKRKDDSKVLFVFQYKFDSSFFEE